MDLETQMTSCCLLGAVSPWITNFADTRLAVGSRRTCRFGRVDRFSGHWPTFISRIPILGDVDGFLNAQGGSRTLAGFLRPVTDPGLAADGSGGPRGSA